MRTLCDVCESAAAILFCSADEAALCRACDDKVHMCNKLASRHVRVGLAEPSEVPRCDICENAPAFFYCEVDGSSLCLQCDMIVHVGGKRTHERYLLLRQRAEFPGDKSESLDESGAVRGNLVQAKKEPTHVSPNPIMVNNIDCNGKMENKLIDLNARPQRVHGRASTIQEQVNNLFNNHHEPENIVDGSFKREPENNGGILNVESFDEHCLRWN